MSRHRGRRRPDPNPARRKPVTDAVRHEKFLDPMYVNEKMVLNCAAYLFKGVSLEIEHDERENKERLGGIEIGIPFLKELLRTPVLTGQARTISMEENRSIRRYTVGGLHMAVLDELHKRKMVRQLPGKQMSTFTQAGEAYFDIEAVLRPSDYAALIGTIKILGPLVGQLFRDFGDKLLKQGSSDFFDHNVMRESVNSYEQSVMSLLDKLERDYFTSNQLEMVMWPREENGRALRVVDLDVSDFEPAELRAKLSGGNFHIIGKVVSSVGPGQRIDLLQKTVLSNSGKLINTIIAALGDKEVTAKQRIHMNNVKAVAEKIIDLEIQGPAVRVAAMSVCV